MACGCKKGYTVTWATGHKKVQTLTQAMTLARRHGGTYKKG